MEQQSEIKIQILHPTDGRIITIELDNSYTSSEIITELIENNFLSSSLGGYRIAIKGGNSLDINSTLRDLNIKNGTILRIVPATDAG